MAPIRIAVVDDDPNTYTVVRKALAPLNADLRAVQSAYDGLALIKDWTPSAIVVSTDIEDGFSLCDRVKQTLTLKNVPVVMVTAEGRRPALVLHRRGATRADAYLHKPLDAEGMLATIRPLLGLSGTQISGTLEAALDEILSFEGVEISRPRPPAPPLPVDDEPIFPTGPEPSPESEAPFVDDALLDAAPEVLTEDALELEEDDVAELPPPPPEPVPAPLTPTSEPIAPPVSEPDAAPTSGVDLAQRDARIGELEETLDALQDQFEEALEDAGVAQRQLQEVRREAESLRAELTAVQEKLTAAHADLDRALTTAEQAEAHRDHLRQEVTASDQLFAGLEIEQTQLLRARDELARRVEELEAQNEGAQSEALARIQALETELADSRDALNAMETDRARLRDELAEAQRALEAIEQERDELRDERDRLADNIDDADRSARKLERLTRRVSELETTIADASAEQRAREELVASLQGDLTEAREHLADRETERDLARADLDAARARADQLETWLQESRDTRTDLEKMLQEERARARNADGLLAQERVRSESLLRTLTERRGAEGTQAAVSEAELASVRERAAQAERDSSEASAELTTLRAERDELAAALAELERKHDGLPRALGAQGAIDDSDDSDESVDEAQPTGQYVSLEDPESTGQRLNELEQALQDAKGQRQRLERSLAEVSAERDRLEEAINATPAPRSLAESTPAAPPPGAPAMPPTDGVDADRMRLVVERVQEAIDRARRGVENQQEMTAQELNGWRSIERELGITIQEILRANMGGGGAKVPLNNLMEQLQRILTQGSGILDRRRAVEDSLERLLEQVSAAIRAAME